MTKDKLYTVGVFTKEWLSTVRYEKQGLTKTEIAEKLAAREYCNSYRDELPVNTFIKDLYDDLADEILLNNYELEVAKMWKVSYKRLERTFSKLAINWKESLRLKREALAEGKQLAKKIGVSSKGNPIFDDGVQWMVYFTDPYYCALMPNPKAFLGKDGEWHFPKTRFIWKMQQNSRLPIRFSKYEQDNKINKLSIPLHYGSKNNFI